jgi:peptidoglycan/LPS O-acetylase OafA/YrhL
VSVESSAVAIDGTVSTRSPALRLRNVSELRLFFAASVLLSHAATLANPAGYAPLRMVLNSEAAVQGFFVLSAFLVCGSYSRILDPLKFYKRRFLRIYPAYIMAVLLFLGLGIAQALLRGVPVAWNELPRYLAANLSTLNFIQPTLGGVFAGNAITAINGALWSIKVELMFYAVLPLLFAVGQRTSFFALAAVMIAAGALYWPILTWLGESLGVAWPPSFRYQLPGQLHFFGLGVALFAWSRHKIGTRGMMALAVWAPLLLVMVGARYEATHALVLVTIIAGVTALPQVPDVLLGQDTSYGVYLSHFPLIQLLLAAGMGAAPFALYAVTVAALAFAYGLLSWRFVEKPALSLGYR